MTEDKMGIEALVEPSEIADRSESTSKKAADGQSVGRRLGILEESDKIYKIAKGSVATIKRGEEDWYVFAAFLNTTKYLETNVGMNDVDYDKFIVSHILEHLNFEQTKKLLDYIYVKPEGELSEFEQKVKEYYNGLLLKAKGIIGIIIPKENKQFLLVKDASEKWENGRQEDYTDLTSELKRLIVPTTMYNTEVGFVGNFKNEYNIFKVKNMEDKRSKGARCDQSGKSDAIKTLNTIIGTNKYTVENIKGRNKIEFCVLQEMYLRYFDKTRKNGKRWFLNQSESIVNNIEKVSV